MFSAFPQPVQRRKSSISSHWVRELEKGIITKYKVLIQYWASHLHYSLKWLKNSFAFSHS